MKNLRYFINGGTVDNAVIMRQWQLCQEAQQLAIDIETTSGAFWVALQDQVIHIKTWERFNRRHNAMIDLIFEYNKAEKIYREHGQEIKQAILRAL